ncbi:MAG: hypothetical protein JW861_12470, partial [Bacteroidales bacterium]|nr:hypothetical protein [Bacteroidales bacterium]
MKTKANKVLLLSLILAGLALTGYPQGLTNSGGYITGSSSSYIIFNGGSNMTLKSTTPDRTTFGNMKIDFTGTNTYKLTIPDDSYVTVSGTLTLDDSLYLEASSSGMASLITNGSVSGTQCTVEEFLVDDQWHLVSSPVA